MVKTTVVKTTRKQKKDDPEWDARRWLTMLFYWLIGIVSSLAFFLVLYFALRIDSNISSIIANTYGEPLYFWPYVILTVGTVILFGVNIVLLVHRWRKFGRPKLKTEAGGGAGTLVGIAASACPVCGSTILAAIGIAGGLAVFPLQGLELKILSFVLLLFPIWLLRRDFKKLECGGRSCPKPKDYQFKMSDQAWFFILLALLLGLSFIGWNWLKTEAVIPPALAEGGILNLSDNKLNNADISGTGNALINGVTAKVLPEKGFKSKIVLEGSIVKLVQNGVIDKGKFLAIYASRGGLPIDLKDVLDKPSKKPILLTRKNAGYYVNLMWPIGLSNYMSSNEESPVNGKSLFNFASTGGWNLGVAENGGEYFNKFEIVELTPEQEEMVLKIAKNSYRPCCNNSTFFQDCNHGSALLGLLQLGAAQGLSEDELWSEALAFNSFWFPHNYVQTALYFKAVKNTDWDKVDPREVLGKTYSSSGGWRTTVDAEIKRLDLVPQQKGGASCGT